MTFVVTSLLADSARFGPLINRVEVDVLMRDQFGYMFAVIEV